MKSYPQPIAPEMLIPKIGEYLVERGYITQKNLDDALVIQNNSASEDTPRLLGQILVESGMLERSLLDRAVTELFLNLRQALEQNNRMLELRVQQRTAELADALQKINELNQLKTNFISNISHELRTPLTHIKGYLELLVSRDLGVLDQEQVKVLQVMNRSANRLEHLIDDLIMFTFAEYDEVLITPREFDLVAVTLEVIQNYQEISPTSQIQFIIDPPSPSVWVYADQKKIGWVINHLVENAVKFSMPETQINITLTNMQENVVIEVKDQGIGIARERLDEIFEPFHQLDGSSTRRYGGIGLGLALAKKILEAHKSHLNVESWPGLGSKFDFSLERLIK
jgi:two-component system sensor histidine kinase/response regulator